MSGKKDAGMLRDGWNIGGALKAYLENPSPETHEKLKQALRRNPSARKILDGARTQEGREEK